MRKQIKTGGLMKTRKAHKHNYDPILKGCDTCEQSEAVHKHDIDCNASIEGKADPDCSKCTHSDVRNEVKPTNERSEFTPGPWNVEHPYGEPGVYVAGPNTQLVAKVFTQLKHEGDIEANARLIAAAPELLSRLKTAMAYMEAKGEQPDWVSETRTIIAKASGK